jgi:hypothetical protein
MPAEFPCPSCGGTEWKADYYEAVWQTISLFVGDDGKPVFGDYTGVTGSYDDGSTADEAWVCRSCDHRLELCEFKMVPVTATQREESDGTQTD